MTRPHPAGDRSLDAAGQLLRDLAPQVLGAIVRRFGDFAASEDAVQEALIAAATQWPREGLPDNPRGWLIQVAARRMTDHIRAESARRRREFAIVGPVPLDERIDPGPRPGEAGEQDDTLLLLFMCCHPSLTPASAIALTLRAIGGLTTAEIARAFLVPEATMAQRISRAKRTIRESGVGFTPPDPAEWNQRLHAVLQVLYLIFNEGYATSGGQSLQRRDLASEAIRLARHVHALAPDVAEVAGLLALMLLNDARRSARAGEHGDIIPLDEQDRRQWDRSAIAEGVALLTSTLARGQVGPYQLQAAIAAVHDEAERYEDTDWPQILILYGLLSRMSDNPMVRLNETVAHAMVHGAEAGLAQLDALAADERLQGNHRLAAVRAHLLERAGRNAEAIAQYREAARRTVSTPERNYLLKKAGALEFRSPG